MKNQSITFFLIILLLSLFIPNIAQSQRQMEALDRGVVAVKVQQGVYVSWRILGTEWNGVTYNIYRDGVKLNSQPLVVSNFSDEGGSLSSTYTVSSILKDQEQPQSQPVTPLAKQYKEIILKSRNTSVYEINDATTADLDGDGEYEIIIKRIAKGWNETNTNYSYFEAYKMDGTLLWEINVGPNILPDVEINIAAFDFDGDGKAEVFMRTSEGTIFGDGTQIGDTDNDGRTNYRYVVGTTANMQYMTAGPEFLSLIDGMTGAELDRVDFIPRGKASDWGDTYGHRCSKYFFGAPYLDGLKPSLFIGRGIYTKTEMRTYDVVNKKLIFRWEFKSGNSGPYFGQGNHNYTIADVDQDGRDEIVWGSMTVDDNGQGLYSTDMGHGDALHVGDLDPYRKGTEIFKCLEESPEFGTILYDGATGKILIHNYTTGDCGRCCAANISDDIKGSALWGGAKMFSASTKKMVGTSGGPENYRIYWDGDLLEEMTDHIDFTTTSGYGTGAIYKYKNGSAYVSLTATGSTSCNYTKGTPSLQADLFGDWREEVVWRREDNKAIRIYTTIDPTIYRNYTLMHDHQYRQAICWQMCGYNQPPHVSYFLGEGEGITVPPPPVMTNSRLVYTGGDVWDGTTQAWTKDGVTMAYADDEHVHFDISAGSDVKLHLAQSVMPEAVTVNSEGNYTIDALAGRLSGNMFLVKQGMGTLKLNGVHDYTGRTEVWNGTLVFDGELQNSPVWLNLFGEMYANGELMKGATLRYGSILNVGEADSVGRLIIGSDLNLESNAQVSFDLYQPNSESNDSLTILGNLVLAEDVVFDIHANLEAGQTKLVPGDYFLIDVKGDVSGDLSKVKIEGVLGTAASLKLVGGKIYLVVKEVRSSSSIIWNGDKTGSVWDMSVTDNFLNNEGSDIFVDRDQVIFNDVAISKIVNINDIVTPASVSVDASSDYVFQGEGNISGNSTLTKSGTGTLKIDNLNEFTGKVLISSGTIEVAQMPNSITAGAIGVESVDPENFEINGGVLSVSEENTTNRALFLGTNGGTINNNHKLTWYEAISGGELTKTGTGELILVKKNTHSKTILNGGTLTMQNDDANPGQLVSIEAGTLQCSDNMYSYNTISWNIEVPALKNAVINLDSRGTYTGTLTGAGNINLNIPNVRSDLNGDWSAFSGTLNFISTYDNSSNYSAELRLNHSKGVPKAMVNINSSVSASNVNGTAMILGGLTGKGTLSGSENYQIGAKGVDCTFDGYITAGSLTKVGAGEFTLSNANTFTGTTTINGGSLNVANKTGSATGTGTVTVAANGTLTGIGLIGGLVNVEKNGNLAPGYKTVGTKLTLNNSLNLKSGSNLKVNVNPLFVLSDKLVVTGKITIAGNLILTNNTSSSFSDGNRFVLFECNSITGTFASITPATPGDGLAWDFSELNSLGVLKVVKVTSASSINLNDIKCYPNPVCEDFNVEISDQQIGTLMNIIDVSGRICYSESLNSTRNRFNLKYLANGVYQVQLIQNNEKRNFKLIKN